MTYMRTWYVYIERCDTFSTSSRRSEGDRVPPYVRCVRWSVDRRSPYVTLPCERHDMRLSSSSVRSLPRSRAVQLTVAYVIARSDCRHYTSAVRPSVRQSSPFVGRRTVGQPVGRSVHGFPTDCSSCSWFVQRLPRLSSDKCAPILTRRRDDELVCLTGWINA